MAQQRILRSRKDGKSEQRFIIKYFTLADETPINIWTRLCRVHGAQTLSQTAVRNWYRRFKADPRASCLDQLRCGGPRTARNQRTIERVRRLITTDCRLTVRDIALQVRVSVGSVHKIIREDLKLKKIAARFVPKLLTDEQRVRRVQVCRDNLQKLVDEPLLLKNMITGDESWVYTYDPVRKQRASAWVGSQDARPQSALRPKSQKRIMLTVFFDDTSMIRHEFSQKTVNRFHYTKFLARLWEDVRCKRPGLWAPGHRRQHRLLLHHDNVPAHKALHTRASLVETGVQLLEQPPYSPDLTPSDFWLFPHLKQVLRGRRFNNLQELQDEVSRVLHRIPVAEFCTAFQDLQARWQKCIDADGHYFEGVRHLRAANAQVANP